MPLDINVYIERTTGFWTVQGAQLVTDIIAKVKAERITPDQLEAFIRAELQRMGYRDLVKKTLAEAITASAAYGIGAVAISAPARKWLLEKAVNADGLKFSARVNNLARTEEMVDYIKIALKKGEGLKMAAQHLSDKGIQSADVAKGIQELTHAARQAAAAADDPLIAQNVRIAARQAQRAVNRLVDPDKSKLRRAYQDVIDTAETSKIKAIEKAAQYAAVYKERYNAERIIATESARAYGKGFFSNIADDDDIVGWRSVLNSAHKTTDICDFWASVDLFGMGPGCFPKGKAPDYPYHPFCACTLRPIIAGDIEAKKKPIPENAIEYLQKLPQQSQTQLLGKAGAESFSENPDQWTDYLKNYTPPKKITGLIPGSVLHGE